MFEQLFDRAVCSTGDVGATSGSATFRDTTLNVGDSIRADFTWLEAEKFGGHYAIMGIIDPTGETVVSYIECDNANGSYPLSYIANMVGIWTAKIFVSSGGGAWLVYTDTVNVIGGEGEADIVAVDAPSTFTPGVAFYIYAEILNVGNIADYLFAKLTNVNTGAVLYEDTSDTPIGLNTKWIQAMSVTLTQTTDFHGLIDAGHLE
jgi:hypothetical protein